MSATTDVRTTARAGVRRPDRLVGGLLLLAGVTFVAGGALHPADGGEGSKVQQLHDMLVDPAWYPSHALMLVALAGFAAAVLVLWVEGVADPRMARLTGVVAVVAVLGVVGMTLHLFAATGADALADGQETWLYHLQTWNETVVDAVWALGMTALAVAGGLTRSLGNRVTAAVGLVGGLAFGLASATIAFTDLFDGLFPVGSLLGVWAVVTGVLVARRRAA
jgi:hypothetical protein